MGRKRLYKPEEMPVGDRMELTGKMKRYSWQYLNNFNKIGKEMFPIVKFKHVNEDGKLFIERVK